MKIGARFWKNLTDSLSSHPDTRLVGFACPRLYCIGGEIGGAFPSSIVWSPWPNLSSQPELWLDDCIIHSSSYNLKCIHVQSEPESQKSEVKSRRAPVPSADLQRPTIWILNIVRESQRPFLRPGFVKYAHRCASPHPHHIFIVNINNNCGLRLYPG